MTATGRSCSSEEGRERPPERPTHRDQQHTRSHFRRLYARPPNAVLRRLRGVVRLWRLTPEPQPVGVLGRVGAIQQAALAPDGRTLITVGEGGDDLEPGHVKLGPAHLHDRRPQPVTEGAAPIRAAGHAPRRLLHVALISRIAWHALARPVRASGGGRAARSATTTRRRFASVGAALAVAVVLCLLVGTSYSASPR